MHHRGNSRRGAARARWLAQVGEALDDAQRLMLLLGSRQSSGDLLNLRARIQAVRAEVEALARTAHRSADNEFDPSWMQFDRAYLPRHETG